MTTFTSVTDGVDYPQAAHINQYGTLFQQIPGPDGWMENGAILVSVASNNITVALKNKAGNNPSASDPVTVWINGTKRQCTAALSVTKNAGTNWFNAGSAELATKEIDYFAYLIWNTTPATDIMDIGFARIPHGRVYSDFSGTTTNEKYMAFANASTPTSTDSLVVIGRFAATLSAGAGYTWSVPTFTNTNLIQTPILESRWLTWVPVVQAGNPTYGTVTYPLARYKVRDAHVLYEFGASGTGSGTAGTNIAFTLPFEGAQAGLTDPPLLGPGWTSDGSVSCQAFLVAGTPDLIKFFKYNIGNFTNSTTYTLRSTGFYEI